MEATPRIILKRRARLLMPVWIVCFFLPEIVSYLRWQYPKLKKLPMVGLAVTVFVGAVLSDSESTQKAKPRAGRSTTRSSSEKPHSECTTTNQTSAYRKSMAPLQTMKLETDASLTMSSPRSMRVARPSFSQSAKITSSTSQIGSAGLCDTSSCYKVG